MSANHFERAAVKRRTSASTRDVAEPPKALTPLLAKPEPTPGTYAASSVAVVSVSPIARANEFSNADVTRSRTDVDVSERSRTESFSATRDEARSERSERDEGSLDEGSVCFVVSSAYAPPPYPASAEAPEPYPSPLDRVAGRAALQSTLSSA